MGKVVPAITPAPGDRLQKFVGDHVRFVLRDSSGQGLANGWSARLRTNLGSAGRLRQEIIHAHTKSLPLAGASWRDLPMAPEAGEWMLELPLPQPGYFQAKPFLLDPQGWQYWPEGPNIGIAVHPNAYRTANTIYCAFPRLLGPTRASSNTQNEKIEGQIQGFEKQGYTVLPPSGKLRDLISHLPHIIQDLGCRILHLLPVNPTPAAYARFGRMGSPYAALDLTAIDPALIEFDQRTTGIDQFRELTCAVHLLGARLFLDIVINHTGWSSTLQENHPEWFLRNPDGTFASPGAWGDTWKDLVELKHDNVGLWDNLADTFLTWCRRGVDGFRCDAGYMVPARAWQYIVARVQQEYPDTVFLLEGLGGAWEITEHLLTEGGMQWAYSELFQNFSAPQVAGYLDHSFSQNERVGLLIHYSETHDNNRLAARGKAWSLLRNRLCALASVSGGFGFASGVEWLATEKIDVHHPTGLAWGNHENLVPELARLNALLKEHPCFFDGARVRRLSPPESPVYALLRQSAEERDFVLVLVNLDTERAQALKLNLALVLPAVQDGTGISLSHRMGEARGEGDCSGTFPFVHELLSQSRPEIKLLPPDEALISMPPGAAFCLSPAIQPLGLSGEAYRRARAQAAWAIQALTGDLTLEEIGRFEWRALAEIIERSPFRFLAAIRHLKTRKQFDLCTALKNVPAGNSFPNVIRWNSKDRHRITPVPPHHWLLIEDTAPFRASLEMEPGMTGSASRQHAESIAVADGHVACFPPMASAGAAELSLERYNMTAQRVSASILFLDPEPLFSTGPQAPRASQRVLLTNGIGGMSRICVDLGRVRSKYDCLLGANLHPSVPVDRHVFAKRIRVWVNADGFISPLDLNNLLSFEAGPPAIWHFVANAGDGRTAEIEVRAAMIPGRNSTLFHFSRPSAAQATGKQLPQDADVRLTVRVDIEDRNFHSETKRNPGAEHHFSTNIHALSSQAPGSHKGGSTQANPASRCDLRVGFAFTPAKDRQLRVCADAGKYHPQPEWSDNIPHPLEQSRGQVGSGDAYSPGWFELPMAKGSEANLVITAESMDALPSEISNFKFEISNTRNGFAEKLQRAAGAFVVRRGAGKTVIAGYPWFLDWGRDTLICARGLVAAGMTQEVKDILLTFAHFEKDGTLPNTILGENASNRDTTDAPLWLGVACEELDAAMQETGSPRLKPASGRSAPGSLYETAVDRSGRTLGDVLRSIATHYRNGTPNGIRMDPASGLIWSPSHFTWMDTNYPAGTPREGYPVEIQALWIRLLRQLAVISKPEERKSWNVLAERALASLEKFFWLEDRGWYSDLLIAGGGEPAAQARVDDALRSNCLFPASLGLAQGERAKRCVEAARRYLVVPGALRSLAPLPVSTPLPIRARDGRLLNNPTEPYWGQYEGDEDTRRKPAYHNGTAWTWTFPIFCEALARAWDLAPEAMAAARAYLGSMAGLMDEGCLGHMPEILDGDAPHLPRGCDAQAWGVTEALRVWKLLKS